MFSVPGDGDESDEPNQTAEPGGAGPPLHTGEGRDGHHTTSTQVLLTCSLVTWHDESSPSRRRVADTSRHRFWLPVDVLFNCCMSIHAAFHLFYYLHTFSSQENILFLTSYFAYRFFSCAVLSHYSFLPLSPRLKDSLLGGAILTFSCKHTRPVL
jgi:hypothetical protein